MPYSTAVATAFDVIRKPPSPHTATAGRRKLGSQHAADGEAHRGEAPRLQQRLGQVDRPLLHHPVVVDTDVHQDDAVLRHVIRALRLTATLDFLAFLVTPAT